MLGACNSEKELNVEVFETSAVGNQPTSVTEFIDEEPTTNIRLNPNETFQTITGFGGSFTEALASFLNRLSKVNREKVIEAYFGESGARYSLTRTHMNSCDFSISNHSYAPLVGDVKRILMEALLLFYLMKEKKHIPYN